MTFPLPVSSCRLNNRQTSALHTKTLDAPLSWPKAWADGGAEIYRQEIALALIGPDLKWLIVLARPLSSKSRARPSGPSRTRNCRHKGHKGWQRLTHSDGGSPSSAD
jgi:hypothetical protein